MSKFTKILPFDFKIPPKGWISAPTKTDYYWLWECGKSIYESEVVMVQVNPDGDSGFWRFLDADGEGQDCCRARGVWKKVKGPQ